MSRLKTILNTLIETGTVPPSCRPQFEDYVSCEGGINTFTIEECAIYNRLMDESFAVCKNEGVDIYEIGLEELQTAIGLKTA